MAIHILDNNLINKIAAGEVVERPASVVKELTENSIDAGATSVTVEIKGGGIDMIKITDNGKGIDKDDIPSAFLRHATSKLSKLEDLDSILTLGFRGEALSSIASVAQVEMITKTAEADFGVKYMISGGVPEGESEAAANNGTVFTMKNLFFNTPARRKFLKKPAVEGTYVSETVNRIALGHPHIAIRYINNGNTILQTSGNNDLKTVVMRIYGRDVASNMLDVKAAKDGYKLEGLIAKPIISRANRNYENFFINGRYIKSSIVQDAVHDACKGRLMVGKFPVFVLNLSVPANTVDVNVHPTKLEVRFSDDNFIYELIYDAVNKALSKANLVVEAQWGKNEKNEDSNKNFDEKIDGKFNEKFEEKQKPDTTAVESSVIDEKNNISENYGFGSYEKSGVLIVKESDGCEENNIEASGVTLGGFSEKVANVDKDIDKNTEKNVDDDFFAYKPLDKYKLDGYKSNDVLPENKPVAEVLPKTNGFDTTVSDTKATDTKTFDTDTSDTKSLSDEKSVKSQKKPVNANLFEDEKKPFFNNYKIIGQVFNTYWIVEQNGSLFMIDQHAAHERAIYEELTKKMLEKQAVSQMLLQPVALKLSERQKLTLEENRELLESFGFEIDDFGINTYALRAVPYVFNSPGNAGFFIEILDTLADKSISSIYEQRSDAIATMSCKAAVKGNDRLSYREAEELIQSLLKLENPFSCPHGRPTIIEMTKYELEKKFKRIQN